MSKTRKFERFRNPIYTNGNLIQSFQSLIFGVLVFFLVSSGCIAILVRIHKCFTNIFGFERYFKIMSRRFCSSFKFPNFFTALVLY